ncbi:hypothetical protein PS639_05635 [Pseudomonas fluorescens]|nr:hypothetical protein PS639_05635 [Pseudomonas fluorescens]
MRGSGLHRHRGIGQGLAQCFDHRPVLPGFQQPCRFGADLFGRVLRQPVDQPQQAIRLLEIGQFDQGNPPHSGIFIGQARLQGKNVIVIGYIE